jgi:hypothetical protein
MANEFVNDVSRNPIQVVGDAGKTLLVLGFDINSPLPVDSSWISAIQFDQDKQKVTTYFQNGGSQTNICPTPVFVAYMNSGSKGTFFNLYFKKRR